MTPERFMEGPWQPFNPPAVCVIYCNLADRMVGITTLAYGQADWHALSVTSHSVRNSAILHTLPTSPEDNLFILTLMYIFSSWFWCACFNKMFPKVLCKQAEVDVTDILQPQALTILYFYTQIYNLVLLLNVNILLC